MTPAANVVTLTTINPAYSVVHLYYQTKPKPVLQPNHILGHLTPEAGDYQQPLQHRQQQRGKRLKSKQVDDGRGEIVGPLIPQTLYLCPGLQ